VSSTLLTWIAVGAGVVGAVVVLLFLFGPRE
jgi:hypothetical protein